MTNRPFLCGNCGNYYIAIPTEDTCRLCEEKSHAPHFRTGVIDCHFSQQSATPSEVAMLVLLTTVQEVVTVARAFIEQAGSISTRQEVTSRLSVVEQAFSKAERLFGGMNETVRWAGVFEMPGRRDAAPEERFKSLAVMEQLVNDNRRPPSDLVVLRRSVKVCTEMADEVTGLIAEARVVMGQARQAAMNWTAPTASLPSADDARKQMARDNLAKARAARAAKRAPVGTAA